MLVIEAAQKVIDLSQRVRAYYETEYPKFYPDYPIVPLDGDGPPPPPEERELRDFLHSLSDEIIFLLVTIMYLGRGDFGASSFSENYEELQAVLQTKEHAIIQMVEKAPLASYLSKGLVTLRKKGININSLVQRPTRIAKTPKVTKPKKR